MCGRYVLGEYDIDAIERRFHAGARGKYELRSRYNVAPNDVMPVVVRDTLSFLRWGYAPPWATRTVINARNETLTEKAYFRQAEHCLVPAIGFYEWQRTPAGKVPHFLTTEDQELLAFAGVCNENGYAIVTVPASGVAAAIHARMPLVLTAEDEASWLRGNEVSEGRELVALPVSAVVNRVGTDGPELLAPV